MWSTCKHVHSSCVRYCELVKRVTNIRRRAQIKAAESDTSVNALVAGDESDFERRKRLQDDVIASIRRFSAADRLSREQIHDRKLAGTVPRGKRQ